MSGVGRGGKTPKHADRPLPIWGLILECMADGKWYGHPHLRHRLEAVKVPSASFSAKLQQDCYQRGYVRRAVNPGFDPTALPGAPGSLRWLYQLTDEGREALARCKAKYAEK